MINLNKEQEAQYNKIMNKITLEKDKEILSEHVVNLSKCMVDLSKNTGADLCGQRARVIVAVDYSGSMSNLYDNGTIQQTINKMVPLGLSFDDNGELEVYLFSNDCIKLEELRMSNYSNYVKEVIDTSSFRMEGTKYSPVLKAIADDTGKSNLMGKDVGIGKLLNKLLGKCALHKKDNGEIVFVIFITDGEPFDYTETESIIRRFSYTKTFIQFIGIGPTEFKFLKKLDSLSGRKTDNTGFTDMTDLKQATDEQLYDAVLEEFSKWVSNNK